MLIQFFYVIKKLIYLDIFKDSFAASQFFVILTVVNNWG